MLYKALGFAVWKGAKWYLGRKLPPGRLLAGVAVAAAVANRVAAGADGHTGTLPGPVVALVGEPADGSEDRFAAARHEVAVLTARLGGTVAERDRMAGLATSRR